MTQFLWEAIESEAVIHACNSRKSSNYISVHHNHGLPCVIKTEVEHVCKD